MSLSVVGQVALACGPRRSRSKGPARRVAWSLSGILLLASVPGATAVSREPSDPTAGIELLRFPYPYRAALTVCSDTHETSPERFEAVHRLVNTTEWIRPGSPAWDLLFSDPEIARNPEWADGVQGFGLPIGDSIWLYGPSIGVFERFDAASGRPVPHAHTDGRDYRDIVDAWLRRGWVDALHTPGEGDLSREAVREGLRWLDEAPHRRITVWVGHAEFRAPSAIEPDTEPTLVIVVKNLLRLGTAVLVRTPAEDFVRSRVLHPSPRPFPPLQRVPLWIASGCLASGLVVIGVCLARRRWRTRRFLLGSILAVAFVVGVLYVTPSRYALGDNPGTRYYNADLALEAGFKFFWFIRHPASGALQDRLALPDVAWNRRRSFLRVAKLDDGQPVLTFPRTFFGREGDRVLEPLTEERLDELVASRQAAILYTHWMNQTDTVFSASGLQGLANLRRRYRAGEIWVASTSELVRFESIRTFLQVDAHVEDRRLVVELGPVADPVDGPFWPTPEELRGISFSTRSQLPVAFRIRGVSVPPGRLEWLEEREGRVVRFR